MIKVKNPHILNITMQIIDMAEKRHKSYMYAILNGLKNHLNLIQTS